MENLQSVRNNIVKIVPNVNNNSYWQKVNERGVKTDFGKLDNDGQYITGLTDAEIKDLNDMAKEYYGIADEVTFDNKSIFWKTLFPIYLRYHERHLDLRDPRQKAEYLYLLRTCDFVTTGLDNKTITASHLFVDNQSQAEMKILANKVRRDAEKILMAFEARIEKKQSIQKVISELQAWMILLKCPYKNVTLEIMLSKFMDKIAEDPQKILDIENDKHKDLKVFIEELINEKIVKVNSVDKTVTYSDTHIGYTKDNRASIVAFLLDDENNGLRLGMKQDLQSKKKK